jgi:hypothetical protein
LHLRCLESIVLDLVFTPIYRSFHTLHLPELDEILCRLQFAHVKEIKFRMEWPELRRQKIAEGMQACHLRGVLRFAPDDDGGGYVTLPRRLQDHGPIWRSY